jgi:gliding motility-associated-like protein
MKHFILIAFISFTFFSCKKESTPPSAPQVTYTHWYQTRSSSADTLFSVYIPNTFMPNGDGVNDYFFPKGYFTGNVFSLEIVDRLGELVFRTTDKNYFPGWDGKKKGAIIPVLGTYMYKLKLNDIDVKNYE